jgi:acyl-[acyl-carrier-protein]-phospholipid O-acyltransferase/long-chain-fatty-acid--[acyl-carrier-protein] ligase
MNNLLKVAGSTPFLIAVFLNAFVDLGHKIVIQNTIFKIYDGQEQVILTAIINGLILLPFILLFSPAGFTSDRFAKNHVMRYAAWAAVFLTIGITVCYAMGWFWISFIMTFLLGVQSALYSPAKYGYLKGFFGKQHLAEANGMVQAISIVAILAGTLLMSVLFEMWYPADAVSKSEVLQSLTPIGFILIAGSILELFMMYRLPEVDKGDTSLSFNTKAYLKGQLLKKNLQPVLSRDVIRLSIIGLAMFWSIGQVMLASFPAFAKEQMGETNTLVIQAIIAATGIGIAIGSTIASHFSKNYIETGLIPIGAAGISIGLFILPTLSSPITMGLDFLFIGTMGGIFIVPLNAMIQFYAKDNELGTVLAANNLIQNVGMLSFLILTALFAVFGVSSKQLLMLTAVFAVVGGAYTVYKLPQSLVRFLVTYLMSRHYKVSVDGMEHVPESGGVLLLGNHISWIDWAIIQIAYPRPVHFVMLKIIYERWYLKWFFKLFGTIPIESGPSSTESLDQVAALLNQGKVVCLFPEGTISRTGHLAEFRRGYERAAEAANENVLIQPFYMRGLWGSQFSRSSDKLKSLRSKTGGRDLVVAFGKPINKNTKVDQVKHEVQNLSITSWENHAQSFQTLPQAWIEIVKQQPGEMILADRQKGANKTVSGQEALVIASLLAKKIITRTHEKNIGVIIPQSINCSLINMAILMAGKTIVNIDKSYSSQQIDTNISTIFTTDDIIKDNDLAELKNALTSIDDEIAKLITSNRQTALIKILPTSLLKFALCKKQSPKRTAAIVYRQMDDGSLVSNKLSHTDIIANVKQISDVINTQDSDVVIATLPPTLSSGLILNQFLPLIEGIPLICPLLDADPLSMLKSIAKFRVTVLFGENYLFESLLEEPKAHALMLESLRIVISSGKALTLETNKEFKLRFEKNIYNSYSGDDSTAIASINLPDAIDLNSWQIQLGGKSGSLGMALPGTSFVVVDPFTNQSLSAGTTGKVMVSGKRTSLKQDNYELNGLNYYATEDSGFIDEDGFLFITNQ